MYHALVRRDGEGGLLEKDAASVSSQPLGMTVSAPDWAHRGTEAGEGASAVVTHRS